MTKNIEKIFLGVLWLMTVALAITFWMNTRYGFNIFSSAHWTYLSTLQANRAQIKPDFYISLLVALVIGTVGLYLIIHPHVRKLKIFGFFGKRAATPVNKSTEKKSSQPNIFGLSRPRSPLSGTMKKTPTYKPATATTTTPTTTPSATTPTPQPNLVQDEKNLEIKKLFEEAGYETIPAKKIENIISPVFAFSYDMTLIIASANTSPSETMRAIGTLMTFCEDSLGENFSELMLRGYIVSPTGEANPNPELILTFDNTDALRTFLTEHKNEKPKDFDKDLHEAFSLFLKTMINYMGKM